MKHLNLLLITIFLIASQNIKAAETEPNNDRGTANTLALNGSNSGAIGTATDEDWWKITTTSDGKLDVTITISNSLHLWCYIYDNDGTTLLSSGYNNVIKTVSKDGLAAGVYYLKLVPYYAGQMPVYTVSNTLTVPPEANDAETNDTRAQAITLPLNGSKTGHAGYYYNNQRDSSDWYKITTNADGRLRLSLTPGRVEHVWIYLYDNDGTTLLNSSYDDVAFSQNTDGLAAGTYYIRIKCYYNYEFAPYSLSDSLFTPAQANDNEPNNSRAQAISLPLNGSKTGQAGYYYNNQRDSADWYKITTNADGLLRLSLTPGRVEHVWIYLYDNDGSTLLNSSYDDVAFSQSTDGLAAGTYYIKIKCYYNYEFAPYTLSDSLFTYSNSKDQEPNGRPYQAKTILANGATTGHVNFYYNNSRDTLDWWKINYTGTGNLTFTINQEPWKLNGAYHHLYFQVYKDTAAPPIYSDYSIAATWGVNLPALTQSYYWIKVFPYYNNQHVSYSFTNSFSQANIAKISITSYDTVGSCSSTNTIKMKCAQSSPPYTVQLYRFGLAYGSPVTTTKNVTFNNLPNGSYYAIAYGDGATGAAFGKSKSVAIEPVPAGLNTTNIASNKATLNWTVVSCAAYYSVQYKIHDAQDWTTKKTTGNVSSYLLKSLAPNTSYHWRVAAADSANGITATGVYSDSITFTTASTLVAATDEAEENLSVTGAAKNQFASVSVSPNPATSFFTISVNNNRSQKLNAILFDGSGKTVWTSGLINADALNGKRVNVSQVGKGVFYLKVMNENGEAAGTAKLIISQ
jgi:hypothetical protein